MNTLESFDFSKVTSGKRAHAKKHGLTAFIFFHPDCHCWSRSSTGSAETIRLPVADYTASGELHPALKTKYSVVLLSVYDRPDEIAIGDFIFFVYFFDGLQEKQRRRAYLC